jgi:hypothetical protein
MVVAAGFWAYVLGTLPPHYDFGGHVFDRIDFMHEHALVRYAEAVAVVSMLVTSLATAIHAALAARSIRRLPVGSAATATIAAIAMLASTALYMAGMSKFEYAHLNWVLPAEMVAAAVVAIAGVASWWIAHEDREMRSLQRIPMARGSLRGVDPRGGHHDRQGADPRSE